MLQDSKSFLHFISAKRGLTLFLISLGSALIIIGSLRVIDAVEIGLIVFFLWSSVDIINNIYDADLDAISAPSRSKYVKKLNKRVYLVACAFAFLCLSLGVITNVPLVFLLIGGGLLLGVLYSVPPFRIRKTVVKPLANFAVGAAPVIIAAAFYNLFNISIFALALFLGATTIVKSLYEDLADYDGDFQSGSKTVPVVFGYRRGLIYTIRAGYLIVPLCVMVGVLFSLNWFYYISLLVVVLFGSVHRMKALNLARSITMDNEENDKRLKSMGSILAKDFEVIAILFGCILIISSVLKIFG